MKIFDNQYLDDLTGQAKAGPRLRQHQNIHQNYQDACQRLFNTIEPSSFIYPHRHTIELEEELLISIRGSMALIAFDDQGTVNGSLRFSAEKYGNDLAAGVEVTSKTWPTLIALEPGYILLEAKAGSFDPSQPKDPSAWGPKEGSDTANN